MLVKKMYGEFSNDSLVDEREHGPKTQNVSDDTKTFQDKIVNLGVEKISRYKLGSFIRASESKNILIATRGRSGSSFLGDLLGQYPGTFYSYEPLHFLMNEASQTISTSVQEQIQLIKQVFQCTPSSQYIQHPRSWGALLSHNFRYRNACKSFKTSKTICFEPDVYSSSCSHFPIRLIKSIRVPFEKIEELLLDPEIGKTLKIIYLFRDPRGRLQSLKHSVHWCTPHKETIDKCNVSNLCAQLKSLVSEALKVKTKYSG